VRAFTCNLDLSKSTEQKLRWDEDVDGTKFELYIPKWRVPEPTPHLITVKIADASKFDPEQELSPGKQCELSSAGLTSDQIREINSLLPVTWTNKPDRDSPIIAVVAFDRVHTETVRYSPIGALPEDWEIGQPYIPISVLPADYPRRLILQVTWKYKG
jgi:hypothetical protein